VSKIVVLKLNEMMNSEKVKLFTHKLGTNDCGIAPVSRFNDAPKGFHPADLFPKTRSVIAFAKQIPRSTLSLSTSIPYTVFETVSLHETHRIAYELVLYLETNGYEAVIVPSEPYEYWDVENMTGKGLVSLKHIAHKAGLGVFGKNHLLYHPQLGNLMRLGAVLTNAELEPDDMIVQDICKAGCDLCISSCPSGAITEETVIQAKCRPYSSVTNLKGESIYACNVCRRVCPNVYGFEKVN
jgi:epoxyqueuosine reductase